GACAVAVRSAALRTAHHELWWGEYKFEGDAARSAGWDRAKSAVGEGERGRPGQHQAQRIRDAVSGQIACSRKGVWGSRARRRDGGAVSTLHVRVESGSRINRYTLAWISALQSCGPPASGLGNRTGGKRQWARKAEGVQ